MKLKSLSLCKKNEELGRVDAEKFGIKSGTFYDIKKNRDKIQKHFLTLDDDGSSKKVQKRIKPTKFTDSDQAVYKWYKQK
ncbi:Tigger transposable element-derived protein 7-like 75 [Homarus americanus]|uniref:Tigger transposable element-derived protein 7-like 75 n=1 Tax=Homarus americanus TaxID=6706 RepID=A0A8J5MXR3_HOMAM|nr:Tigger transposable element-derived protein 7-like 75 [Homarus americanus]